MRAIHQIAKDIASDWKNVNFAAWPYLLAMCELTNITDMYFMDDARGIVLRFLSNASTYRGENAQKYKAELKALLK